MNLILKIKMLLKWVLDKGRYFFLAEQAKKFNCFEIDTSLKEILDPIENAYPNLKVIYADFMIADLGSLPDELHVVANVPYYITTPIIFKLLETKNSENRFFDDSKRGL